MGKNREIDKITPDNICATWWRKGYIWNVWICFFYLFIDESRMKKLKDKSNDTSEVKSNKWKDMG